MFIICNSSSNVTPAAARGAQEDVGRVKGERKEKSGSELVRRIKTEVLGMNWSYCGSY